MNLPIVELKDSAPDNLKRAFARLKPGTVCVSIERHGTTFVYYEGGIYTRGDRDATPDERKSYALHAAGRAAYNNGRGYPTVAFLGVADDEVKFLEQKGAVDTETWQVAFW